MSQTKLTRSSSDKMLGGVCGGLSKYIGVDVSLVRLVTALIVIFTGFGPLIYLLMWAILPEDGTNRSGLDQLKDEAGKLKGNAKRSSESGYENYRPND